MEYNGFYIDENLGNNAFSYEKRKNKKIYIPKLSKIEPKREIILDGIKQSSKIGFSEIDEDGKENNIFGLENFIYTEKDGKKIYIFDNHNHCFYFVSSNIIKDIKNDDMKLEDIYFQDLKNIMIHFDQHKDMRIPDLSLNNFAKIKAYKSLDELLFSYTNHHLNVGNFIMPLKENNFISDVYIIDSNYSMENLKENLYKIKTEYEDIVLDIDLDFFSEDMDYIDDCKKIDLISKSYEISNIITICTSPYFIEFERAKSYLDILLKAFGL